MASPISFILMICKTCPPNVTLELQFFLPHNFVHLLLSGSLVRAARTALTPMNVAHGQF
jgi:hypothetical protein